MGQCVNINTIDYYKYIVCTFPNKSIAVFEGVLLPWPKSSTKLRWKPLTAIHLRPAILNNLAWSLSPDDNLGQRSPLNTNETSILLDRSFRLYLCGCLSDHDQTLTSYCFGSPNLLWEVSRMSVQNFSRCRRMKNALPYILHLLVLMMLLSHDLVMS